MALPWTNATAAGGGRRRILELQLLALLPATLAAICNTGYQLLREPLDAGTLAGADLRGWLVMRLVLHPQDPGLYDYLVAGLAYLLPLLLLALLVGGLWERVAAERGRRPIEPGFVLVALLFTLLLPGAAAFTHVIFGMTCAILLGKAIFGGEGKSFINPALLGIAIVQISFPASTGGQPLWSGLAGYTGSDAIAIYYRGGEAALAQAGIDPWSAFIGMIPGPLGTTSLLAVALGAALLLFTRVIAWRLLLAQLLGLLLFASLARAVGGATELPAYWHLLLGSFAFGAVFIACDPVASPCTNPGRWILGFLIAALLVSIRSLNPTHPDAVVPVLLLASILAPLVDHAVIAWNIRKRGQRHV
jgi:Na+-transporting NADH:ubiquinone oxidoreductase subunit B